MMQRALKVATPVARFTRNAGSISYNRTPTTRRSQIARVNRSLATMASEKQSLEDRLTEAPRATQVARAAGATVGLATMITGMAAYATVCGGVDAVQHFWRIQNFDLLSVGGHWRGRNVSSDTREAISGQTAEKRISLLHGEFHR